MSYEKPEDRIRAVDEIVRNRYLMPSGTFFIVPDKWNPEGKGFMVTFVYDECDVKETSRSVGLLNAGDDRWCVYGPGVVEGGLIVDSFEAGLKSFKKSIECTQRHIRGLYEK